MIYLPRAAALALATVVGTMAAVLIALVVWSIEGKARGGDEVDAVAVAVRRLQPAVGLERADALAAVMVAAGAEVDVDPLLLVAIAMRESSLSLRVERLDRRGARGELGLMQCWGAALELRPAGCDEQLHGADCQVRTGARWLAHARERCPGSTARWVMAYGAGRCPSEAEAHGDRLVAIARSHYARVGGERW